MFRSIAEAIFHYADETPQALCAADAKQAYTYAQMKNAALFAAAGLEALGVSRGDRVLVECTQNAAYCVCQLGIALLGAVFVPFDRKFSAERLAEMARETEAVCLIGTKSDRLKLPFFPVSSLSPDLPEQDYPYSFPQEEELAELLYSTGTTGKSKGIGLTHANNVAIAQNIADGVGMEAHNIEMIPVSLCHSHGLRTTYSNFLNGNAVVIASGVVFLNPFFALMERWQPTAMDLVPGAWRILRQSGAKQLAAFADRIRYVELGSAPLTEDDKQSLRELLPNSRLYNFYGSTESGRTCAYDFSAGDVRPGCIGRPVCNAEALIVDGDHREIPDSSPEKTGYLAFRGPMNMAGYWKNPELTDSVMENGVIYTKDIGYIDADGMICLLGRDDDVINFGGVKISPDELEAAAMQCPGVADCGCIGHDDPVSGQVPWLYVQLSGETTVDEIGACLLRRLDRDKLPRKIIAIEKIPHTFNGKLLRRALRELDTEQ